jgi:uncharacterized protein (DUF58 family)
VPTREAAGLAALIVLLLFIAVNLQAGWVYAVDALLIGFGAAGWLSTLAATRPLSVRRAMPAEVMEGERFTVTLTIGPARWPRFFLQLGEALPGCDPVEIAVPVLGRRALTLAYAVRARRRGVYRAGALTLRSGGLTGMFRLARALDVPGVITVLPRYALLPRFALPGRPGEELSASSRPARAGVEVAGVRDFRAGDDATRIHWRSTARRGALIVREFEREVAPAAALIVDASSGGDEEGFEQLVRAAASVAIHLARQGQPVWLAAGRDGRGMAAAMSGADALRALAAVERGRGPTAADLAALLPVSMPVVVFSASADAVAVVAATGRPVLAVLASPEGQGSLLLEAMGVPVRVLRPGEEVGACLAG